MNFKEILELIDKVAERGIAVVEVERAGTKLRIEARIAAQYMQAGPAPDAMKADLAASQPALLPGGPESGSAAAAAAAEASEAGLHVITSPIVGTFYRAPNPEADPFINVGDRISKGKVLCIIEAMKLMNEIESDVEGVIEKIYPQNGQPIEYGEKLFAVRS